MARLQFLVIVFWCVSFFQEVSAESSEDYDRTYHVIPGIVPELYPEFSDSYCASLESYVVNASEVFSSSTRFILLQGVHEVKVKSFIEVIHAKRVCITGTNHVEFQSVNISYTTLQWIQPESAIRCSKSVRFGFISYKVSEITISKITITGCGG